MDMLTRSRGKVLAAIAVSAALATAAPLHAETYGVGTNPQGSLFYAIGAGISGLVSANTKIRMRVQPSGGTTTFLPLLNRGRLDFAVNNPIETTFAHRGTEMFQGRPNKNLRIVARLFPTHTGLLVRADDKARTLADLKGQRMPAEFTSQQIAKFMITAYFANGGMTYADFRPVPVANVVAGADEFAAGRACCALNLVGSAAVEQANARISGGVRFLSISNDAEAVKRMRAIAPGSYVRALPPAPHFVGVKSRTNFLAWDVLFITAAHVPDDVVYQVAKLLHESKAKLIAVHPAFRGFAPDRMYDKEFEVGYHPGALKFYKEKGMR